MSTTCNQEDGDTLLFRDEIFQWPIAKCESIDVWELIIENYLTSPLDRKNLLLASPQFFGPYLEEAKCSVLLGEVLHILHKNNYLNITNTAFLDYRTLSRSCKTAIDTCLQLDNPCFQNLDGIDHEHGEYLIRGQSTCWEYSTNLEYKMYDSIFNCASLIRSGDIDLKESQTFLCGYLVFSPTRFLHDIRDDFELVLPTIGSQIYHFKFEYSNELYGPMEDLLFDFLGMMPNLRTLTLDILEIQPNSCQLDTRLPNLDHLNVLKIEDAPAELVSALISKYGRHLQKISMRRVSDYNHKIGILSPAVNLAELSLPQIARHCSIGEYLREALGQRNKLKCLSVRIQVNAHHLAERFQELTSALRDIFETGKLHTLNLVIGLWAFWTTKTGKGFYNRDARLKVPFLRRLWIHSLSIEITSIDFILGVSESLEELVLNMRPCALDNSEQKEIIQFFNFWKRMEESNIWKLMPKLQKIKIRIVDFSDTSGLKYISSRP